MTAIRQQIIAAVVDALNADRASYVPEATTRRLLISDELQPPAVSVWTIEERRTREQRSARFGGPDVRSLRIAVQVFYSSTDHEDAESEADRIVAHVDDVLGNTTLDDLAHSVIVDRITWEAVQNERTIIAATVECLIEYQTTRGDSSRHQ